MVLADPQVRRPARLIHPAVKHTIARLGPLASVASADPDAVRPGADLPAQCPEAVRDSHRLALADAPEPKAVSPCQSWQERPQPDALRMAARPCLAQLRDQAVAQKFPLPAVAPEPQLALLKMEPPAVQPVPQDESESPQVRSQEAHSAQVSPQAP